MIRSLTVTARIAVPSLLFPRRRSHPPRGLGVDGVYAETPRDTLVRVRIGVLTGRGDTGELLVKSVQLRRDVLAD